MIPIAKPMIGEKEIKAVNDVLRSGMLAQGEEVAQLEKEFAKYLGVKYAVATSSGTTALHLALLALGIGKGDEVITAPFSFIASSNCLLFVGAKPVFADVNEVDFNINPVAIEKRINKKTKAILIVHLYGQTCEMASILKIARKHRLILIEDACQAHGAEYKGKKAGSFGKVSCFSFYPTKNMTTSEGGMVVSDKKRLTDKLALLRNHGQEQRYFHKLLGYNFRMTNIAAAIGRVQLKKLEKFNKKRITNAEYLSKKLRAIKGIIPPAVLPYRRHIFHQYTVRVTEEYGLTRDELKEKLIKKDIGFGIYYPRLIPDQKLYRGLGFKENFPIAKRLTRQVLSLPIHPALTKKDLDFIVRVIREK